MDKEELQFKLLSLITRGSARHPYGIWVVMKRQYPGKYSRATINRALDEFVTGGITSEEFSYNLPPPPGNSAGGKKLPRQRNRPPKYNHTLTPEGITLLAELFDKMQAKVKNLQKSILMYEEELKKKKS